MPISDELLRLRYGALLFEPVEQWNHCLDTLLSHRSVRAYVPDPLPNGTLETLIAAAQSASTSSNLQTWSVVAVTDTDRKAQLSHFAGNQSYIRQCPLFLVWLADLARLHYVAAQRSLPDAGLDYLEMFVTAIVDASLAAQNAVVAAESMGLGTVYIGAIRNRPEEVTALLKLPSQVFAVFGLCVGYPDPAQPPVIKPRLPQTTVLHRETYDLAGQAPDINQYNQTMRSFYTQQQMPVTGDWSDHSIKRVAGAESLSGRDQLREILHQLGFLLK